MAVVYVDVESQGRNEVKPSQTSPGGGQSKVPGGEERERGGGEKKSPPARPTQPECSDFVTLDVWGWLDNR